jgi:hypothetical protein
MPVLSVVGHTQTSVTVKWEKVTGTQGGYEIVWYTDDAGAKGTKIADGKAGENNTDFEIKGLIAGQNIHIEVKALAGTNVAFTDSATASTTATAASIGTTPLDNPTFSLTSTATTITVTWASVVADAMSYHIEWAQTPDFSGATRGTYLATVVS